ncbi:hypothetical protein EYF80_016458 [Liparis tanakae]|uniref:Uncharacterized protein n=1 Tax=Liparis tanakae TaxID=230148 RepID=A0A4Z2I761_9TELE|nr:hypothetical protein EYF80_016458 [Liparis tanakae]
MTEIRATVLAHGPLSSKPQKSKASFWALWEDGLVENWEKNKAHPDPCDPAVGYHQRETTLTTGTIDLAVSDASCLVGRPPAVALL